MSLIFTLTKDEPYTKQQHFSESTRKNFSHVKITFNKYFFKNRCIVLRISKSVDIFVFS